jgi:membrane-associated phospholipid phosphatase
MRFIRKFLQNNRAYLIPYFILLAIITVVLIIFKKETIHLAINQYHSQFTDIFFKYFTNLGDGLFAYIIAIVFLFFSFRNALLIGLSTAFSGLIAQFIKRVIFHDVERPLKLLAKTPIHIVEGVKMYTNFSFPSGHSTTIFTLCMCLAALSSSMFTKIVLLCTAILVAFSRVYLSQHFLVDIYAGSIIGTLTAILMFYIIQKQKASWLDLSLIKLKKKKDPK